MGLKPRLGRLVPSARKLVMIWWPKDCRIIEKEMRVRNHVLNSAVDGGRGMEEDQVGGEQKSYPP